MPIDRQKDVVVRRKQGSHIVPEVVVILGVDDGGLGWVECRFGRSIEVVHPFLVGCPSETMKTCGAPAKTGSNSTANSTHRGGIEGGPPKGMLTRNEDPLPYWLST